MKTENLPTIDQILYAKEQCNNAGDALDKFILAYQPESEPLKQVFREMLAEAITSASKHGAIFKRLRVIQNDYKEAGFNNSQMIVSNVIEEINEIIG